MNRNLVIGTLIFTVGIVGALTSFIIINSRFLTAAFLSWTVVGIVYIAILSKGVRGGLNPLLALKAYEETVAHLLEEFSLHDVPPYFVPSKYAKEPVMLISSSGEFRFSPVPNRLIIYEKDDYALRIKTLGTVISKDLGGISGGGVVTAENMLKLILVNDMNIADDIIISESPAGDVITVRLLSPLVKHSELSLIAANIYIQLIGTILAEATQKIIKLHEYEVKRKELTSKFMVVGE